MSSCAMGRFGNKGSRPSSPSGPIAPNPSASDQPFAASILAPPCSAGPRRNTTSSSGRSSSLASARSTRTGTTSQPMRSSARSPASSGPTTLCTATRRGRPGASRIRLASAAGVSPPQSGIQRPASNRTRESPVSHESAAIPGTSRALPPSGATCAWNWLAPVTPSDPPKFCRASAGPCCSARPSGSAMISAQRSSRLPAGPATTMVGCSGKPVGAARAAPDAHPPASAANTPRRVTGLGIAFLPGPLRPGPDLHRAERSCQTQSRMGLRNHTQAGSRTARPTARARPKTRARSAPPPPAPRRRPAAGDGCPPAWSPRSRAGHRR